MRIAHVAIAGWVVIILLAIPHNAQPVSWNVNWQGPFGRGVSVVGSGRRARSLLQQAPSQVAAKQEAETKVNVGTGATNVTVKPGSTQQTVYVTAPAGVKVNVKPDGQGSVDVFGKPVTNWGGRKLQQSQQVATVQKSTQNVAAGSGSSNVSVTPGSTQQVVNVKAPAGVIVEVKPDGSGTVKVGDKPVANWVGRKLQQVVVNQPKTKVSLGDTASNNPNIRATTNLVSGP